MEVGLDGIDIFINPGGNKRGSGGDREMKRFNAWLEEYFWPKVQKTHEGCWLWQGSKNELGEAAVEDRRANPLRVTYYLKHHPELLPDCRPLPSHTLTRHCMDNLCVNPDHVVLVIKTKSQKKQESQELQSFKARQQAIGRCRLSEDEASQVLRMKASGQSYTEIAKHFDVVASLIRELCTGRHYRLWDSVNKLRLELGLDRTMVNRHTESRSDRLRKRAKAHRELVERLSGLDEIG